MQLGRGVPPAAGTLGAGPTSILHLGGSGRRWPRGRGRELLGPARRRDLGTIELSIVNVAVELPSDLAPGQVQGLGYPHQVECAPEIPVAGHAPRTDRIP